MNKFLKAFLIALVAVLAIASLLRISKDVNAQPKQQTAYAAETWTTGITVENDLSYSAISGRMITNAASFRSNRAVNDIYYIFPAPSGNRTVSQAKYNILTLEGTPNGIKTMTLEVYNLDGTFLRTISDSLDLTLSAQGSWEDFILIADTSALVIAPGEFLTVHFASEVLEDYEIYPAFEIVTE